MGKKTKSPKTHPEVDTRHGKHVEHQKRNARHTNADSRCVAPPDAGDGCCGLEDTVPRWAPVAIFLCTLIIRVSYVSRKINWWILHPDEVFQSLEGEI